MDQLFVMRLDRQRLALRLREVVKVLSVIDLCSCFQLPAREATLEDVLVLVHSAGGMVALAADGVEGVSSWPEEATVPGADIGPPPLAFEGVVKNAHGLLLICDLDRLIGSLAPVHALGKAARNQGGGGE
jgi:chemotaxis signal transduction protein